VVRQALQLLSCVAAMRLPVESEWVMEVLQTLRGHFASVGLPEVQQLLLLRELLGAVPEPDWVEELLTEVRRSGLRAAPSLRVEVEGGEGGGWRGGLEGEGGGDPQALWARFLVKRVRWALAHSL
jgi:hypothetical protein